MPSLVNTLRRCHSTVRGLMYSCAPISGFVRPSRASRAICASCGGELVARLDRALAHGLTRGEQLDARTLGEAFGAHRGEHLVRGAQLLARVHPALLAAQPLSVDAGGRGRARRGCGCARAARSPRGRARRRRRPRSGAPVTVPGPRAPSRCRSPACTRSGDRARRVSRPPYRCGHPPRSAPPGPTRRSRRRRARRPARGRGARVLVPPETVEEQRGDPLGDAQPHALAPRPSPRASRPRSRATASASWPRQAASISVAYFSGAISVACVIASASSISDEAASKAPAWTWRAARYVTAFGAR